MAMITFQPITTDNFRTTIKLVPADDQTKFVAPNVYSVAEAYVNPSWDPRLILADEVPVGFVMTGRDPETGFDWIIRFMIGHEHQGKGYGRKALGSIISHLKQLPDAREIRLGYVPGNSVAEKLYRAVGFEATEEIEDDEVIMRLVG